MPIVPHFHREISNLPPFIMVVWCWRCFLRASVSLLCVCVCVCVCVRVCASVCVRAPIVWTNLFLKGEGILFAYLGERLSDKLKRGFKYDIGVCLFKKEVDTFFCLNLTLHSTDMFCLYKQRKWYISAMAAAQAGEKENQGD